MAPWNQTTEPVLRRVRKLTLIVEGQLNEPDIACANKVWAHLGVEMARYKEKDNWSFVDEEKRPQVREKLEAIFDGAAFFVDGRVANPARDKFKKADLLAWGACLLAEAAANAAVPDAEFEEALRLLAVVEPEGDEAVDDAAAANATDMAVEPVPVEDALSYLDLAGALRYLDLDGDALGDLGDHAKRLDMLERELEILEQHGQDHRYGPLTDTLNSLGDADRRRSWLPSPWLRRPKRKFEAVANTLNDLGIVLNDLAIA